ncbi:unnamed protein product [Fusarium graminearum]|uniref:Uncharacterized protein n=1 Tax=Gibberella zeae TaxID=5518 RepID=A0A679PA08_GIBZA|nr:unnamed protein product [Fusarium graminearum]CAF3571955.1 unnamed protein product [Fusarium graminearum]CAG1965902.1 unnamed protein product [Fusarium graminearum]CAG1990582.1 unnamed protein product [Fusarium graminearum]CZS83376.1 unnamed protein product [Fusarium graminearum]
MNSSKPQEIMADSAATFYINAYINLSVEMSAALVVSLLSHARKPHGANSAYHDILFHRSLVVLDVEE